MDREFCDEWQDVSTMSSGYKWARVRQRKMGNGCGREKFHGANAHAGSGCFWAVMRHPDMVVSEQCRIMHKDIVEICFLVHIVYLALTMDHSWGVSRPQSSVSFLGREKEFQHDPVIIRKSRDMVSSAQQINHQQVFHSSSYQSAPNECGSSAKTVAYRILKKEYKTQSLPEHHDGISRNPVHISCPTRDNNP